MIEAAGMVTVSVTLKPSISFAAGVPRAGFLRFPIGNPFGEPDNPDLQRDIVSEVLNLAGALTSPNSIADLPFRWRRGRIRV